MSREPYRGTWFYLFLALLSLILIYPLFETESKVPWLLSFFNSVLLLAIIYAASERKRDFWIVGCLGAALLAMDWLPQLKWEIPLIFSLRLIIYLYAIYLVAHHFLFSQCDYAETVFGALSLYLLLGIFWATVFAQLEYSRPGSFYMVVADKFGQTLVWSDFIYFSFITLTTTGYGDIIPVTAVSRSFAILNAVSGLFCLGVLVSGAIGRLVTAKLADEK